jgi:hypothetical protein
MKMAQQPHHRYTEKEHRQVEHIKESEEERGVSPEDAEAIGYATVNKQTPGEVSLY